MKDQYFGDARDYFKYHLLEELLAGVVGLRRLVCLWMLTPPDGSAQGRVQFVENPALPHLSNFLRRQLDLNNGRVRCLREYFLGGGIEYTPWGDEPPYFTNSTRNGYFDRLPTEELRDALFFFDPDNGLTDGQRITPKHLSFDELARVRNRMRGNSLTVVYQHFARKPNFWEGMANALRDCLKAPVGYVAEASVGFYVIPGQSEQVTAIDSCLRAVAKASGGRRVGETRA